ncbi:MAG: hypothetical protein IMZ65_03275 [Planctomycetes bacterium]|nr:hypothetical protein [Planctomycetota bacterium]
MKSNEVIQKAVEGMGVKGVAATMNVSASLVYKWCEGAGASPADEASGTINPLDRVAALWDCTHDVGLIDWLCQRAGGTFVPNPFADRNLDAEYVERTQKIIKDFSELLDALSHSMINDGRVDHTESEHIRRHWQMLKRHAESLVLACEQGMFDPKEAPGGEGGASKPKV